jgi:KRAB domain-containing zinc finger protein
MQYHFYTKMGEKPYKHKICKKGFVQNGEFTRHISKHTGKEPVQGDVCVKGFRRVALLQRTYSH